MESKLLQTIKGDGIELKQLSSSNTEELFSLTEKNRSELREYLPWLDFTKISADSKNFIEQSYEKALKNQAADFGIFENGKLVGIIGYHIIDSSNKKTNIGYWLDKDSQGKGIMTKATKLLIDFAFNELGLNRIQINCAVDNKKSCAIPEKLGFVKEGVSRQAEFLYDHFVDWNQYGLLKNEWNKN